MNDRSGIASLVILVVGAAALVSLSVARLPPLRALRQASATPFDRSGSQTAIPVFALLSRIAPNVPDSASVAVRSEPRDPVQETFLHRAAVALLPGRRVLPAARWDMPTPELEAQAEFLIIRGPRPTPAPGTLILETPQGSLWRRVLP